MSDDDLSIEEKRVYGERGGASEAYVASGTGVVGVRISGDLVGEFDLRHRCAARDVAGDGGVLAVATDEDVLLAGATDETGGGPVDDADTADAGADTSHPTDAGADTSHPTDAGADTSAAADEFRPTEFGPAVAVEIHAGAVVAAAPEGRVARRPVGGGGWTTLGRVDDPRAIDAGLVAAADGVHRITGGGLTHAGLADVNDVAGRGVPLAATSEGLYALGNGWMDAAAGDFRVVDAADGRAHAATPERVYGKVGTALDDWVPVDLPTDERVVGFACASEQVVGVTVDGTIVVSAGDGWRAHPIGVRNVGGVAFVE